MGSEKVEGSENKEAKGHLNGSKRVERGFDLKRVSENFQFLSRNFLFIYVFLEATN